MKKSLTSLAAIAVPVLSTLIEQRQVITGPEVTYIFSICQPLRFNDTRTSDLNLSINGIIPSLANSPYPCEQANYLEAICLANGTTELDFLAEQECLCGGSYWDALAGCYDCEVANGFNPDNSTPEEASSARASLSAAECTPSPPYQPFTNLFPVVNFSDVSTASLRRELFTISDPSSYWTPTASVTPGAITGSATARLTSWTNTAGVRYTPTTTPSSSGKGSSSVAVGSGGSSTSSSVSSSSSGSAAVTEGVEVVGCILAVGMGVIALL